MKTLLSVFVISSLFYISCSKKTVASKDAATNASTESAQTESSIPAGVADANSLAAGKLIYETKCTRCHAMKPILSYSPVRWDGILKLMVPKAQLSAAEAQQVTAYVRANALK